MGFKSVNVDLMFALPGQSLQEWEHDVTTVVGLGNEYSLSYINHLWGGCRREAWPEEVIL